MSGYRPPWPKSAIARLIALHAKQLTFGQIANHLSHEFAFMTFTRNSVIGMAHRLDLPRRQTGPTKPRPEKVKKVAVPALPSAHVSAVPKPPPPEPAPAHGPEPVPAIKVAVGKMTIFQLHKNACRHPYGDDAPYLYCGNPTFGDAVYCLEHCRMHYSAAKGRMPAWRGWAGRG